MQFHLKSQVLRDVEDDIRRCLSAKAQALPIDVHLGMHFGPISPIPGRMTLGIQTEQIRTADGKRGWRRFDPQLLKSNVETCDFVIDYTQLSRKLYRDLGLLNPRKLYLGPYIFPEALPELNNVAAPTALFFGSLLGDWRQSSRLERLNAHSQRHQIIRLQRATFGVELDAAIRAHGMVANVHFIDGVYTEAPRLMKAILNGTALLSEELSAPFEAGRHYADIRQAAPSLSERQAMVRNLFEDFPQFRLSQLVLDQFERFRQRVQPA